MKITFSELVSSEAYQSSASSYTKGVIAVSALVVILNYFLSDTATFLASFLILIVWSVFATSFVVALPVYMIYLLIVVQMSAHTEFPTGVPTNATGRLLKHLSTLSLLGGLALAVFATLEVLLFFNL